MTLTETKLKKIKNIINEYWKGAQISDDDEDEIEYEIYSYKRHSLFLDTNDGSISMGCHFEYDDDPEYEPLANDIEYWIENAFTEYLEKNSEHKICSWHDMCYDLGYPGTDYERYVGFVRVPCTVSVIKEYLQLVKMFETRVSSWKDAIEYLFHSYLKYSRSRNIKCYYDTETANLNNNLNELEVSYEGNEYYFCKAAGQVFLCDLQEYKRINTLFSNCTISYKMGIKDDYLWFVSPCFRIQFEMTIADLSYLELEQYFLQTKQQRNLLAMEQLFGNDAPHKSDKVIQKDKKLAKTIATACIKLIQKPLFINQTENIRNDEIRDYLSMAGYDVKDQTRTGFSSSGISIGEADMMIVENNIPFSFIEALNLKSVDRAYIIEHIERIHKYDRTGTSANFLICYVNSKNPERFTIEYLKLITSYTYTLPVVEFNPDVKDILDTMAANIRIIKQSFNRNRNITDLYHILVFFTS